MKKKKSHSGRKQEVVLNNILEYLESTAEEYADKTAVTDPTGSLNYAQYVEKAKLAGSRLIRTECQGRPVAVIADKCLNVLCAMLGVVYAGGFYVYIDPSQPTTRFAKILEELDPVCCIVQNTYRDHLNETGYEGECINVSEMFDDTVQEEALRAVRSSAKRQDLLYGVFTSGSSGTPKCVAVSHGAVIDFIGHFTETFDFSKDDIIANQAPFDFDVSVKDIYSAMMTGAELLLIPREYFSTPPILLDYLCDHKITTMTWAVSALCLISGMKGLEYRIPEHVNKILFSGEVMPFLHLSKWQEALPKTKFVNVYGPSEITCNCLYHVVDRKYDRKDTAKLPIGIPFKGRKVYVLDKDRKPVSKAMETGELYVAGESLANGYYHNPEQTEKAFVMLEINGESFRAYNTGDLVYYGQDGLLYFVGREDFQIKHMGHRIELEEIDRAIMTMPGIIRSCCLFDRGRNRLVAFYTGEAAPAELRKYLKTRVPAYMVPSRILQREELPLNKNGKLDRAKLMQEFGA